MKLGQKAAWLVKAEASSNQAIKALLRARYAMYKEGFNTDGIARLIKQTLKLDQAARVDLSA